MAKKSKKIDTPEIEFVPLMTVKDKDEAEFIRDQLDANEIPVLIKKQELDPDEQPNVEPGYVLNVPEDQLDEAEAVLDQRASSNEWIIDEDDDYASGSDNSGEYEAYDDYDDDDRYADLEFDESDLEEELF